MEFTMNDKAIHEHIESLVAEEHRLYELSDDRTLTPDERTRLDAVQVQLDRYYDLLRQRRAKREFGQDPNSAKMRSGDTVESYLE
jgi:hypothetical protein